MSSRSLGVLWRFVGVSVLLAFVAISPALAQETVKITWWYNANDFIQNELIPAFEAENPHIDVEYVVVDGSKQDKILAAFLGGTAPDIFWGWPEERIMLPEAGMVLPLDAYLEEWEATDDFFEGAWASARYMGKTYGIPYYLDLRALLYRKDLFDEVGLDSSRPPQSWDELTEAATKIVRRDSNDAIVRAGIHLDPTANSFAPFLWQAGGSFLTSDHSAGNMLSPDSLRALEYFSQLVLEHRVSPAGGFPDAWGKGFWSGSLGMIYANSAVPSRVKANAPEFYDLVGSGLPPKEKERAVLLHADYFAINANSEHPDEAFELLKFFFRPDNLEKFSAVNGTTPPRKSLMMSDYAADNPAMLQILEAAPYGRTQPPMRDSTQFFSATSEMLTAVLNAEMAPRAAAERFNARINALLRQ